MTAPMVLYGAMNGIVFLAYVEQVIIPTLASGPEAEKPQRPPLRNNHVWRQ